MEQLPTIFRFQVTSSYYRPLPLKTRALTSHSLVLAMGSSPRGASRAWNESHKLLTRIMWKGSSIPLRWLKRLDLQIYSRWHAEHFYKSALSAFIDCF